MEGNSSFLVTNTVGNVDIFVFLRFENILDSVISHIKLNSMYHDIFSH